mmetsp:Transcript_29638/g.98201  ORF Transcript_29638/g.98201 Transcript_29638/m.98201 type:complete len:514 (-) Transcript_29638:142-1683(-)
MEYVHGSHAGEQLGPGVQVWIGGRDFRLSELLGEGSFGAVWSATSPGLNCEVAIKEIICRSEVELGRAATEQQLLKFVGRGLVDNPGLKEDSPAAVAAKRFPSLVASEVKALGPDLWQVRLAMTRLAGKPLESLLETANEGTRPTADGSLVETCRCVRSLLDQLVPALEHLGTQALHRDITTRNILVDKTGQNYSFGLVDFGLAVDVVKWKADLLTHDIGGDGHYWPTSSWFVLEYGAHHLESYPALLQEYEADLDVHALGVIALRCLMELWAPEAMVAEAKSKSSPPSWAQTAKLMRLRMAWTNFWDDIARFWQPIFDAFACGGCDALEQLKSLYAQAGVHHMVSADLCAVRAALRELRDVAELNDLRVICDALLLLMRPGKKRDDKPTWRRIRAVLRGERSASRAPSPAVKEVAEEGHPQSRQQFLVGKELPAKTEHGSSQGRNRRDLCDALKTELRGWPSSGVPAASVAASQSTYSPSGPAQGSMWSSASVSSHCGSATVGKPISYLHVS